MLNITTNTNPALGPAAAANFSSSYPFLLYYDADYDLNSSMVFVSGRDTSYANLWSGLVDQVMVDRLLPFNYPLLAAYQAQGQAIYSQPLNLSDPDDQLFVRQIWCVPGLYS